jgi:hypothetical protein
VNGWDAVVDAAVSEAALSIQRKPAQTDVGELAHLQPALTAALQTPLGRRVANGGRVTQLPDWDPGPGPIDVVIRPPDQPTAVQVGIELKSYKLDETIWDIIKMASLRRHPGVEAAYIIVAATERKFSGQSDCAALFRQDPGVPNPSRTDSYFTIWAKAWTNLLLGGRGRPTLVPEQILLERISTHTIPAFPSWEIRALRVDNPDPTNWIRLKRSGWPAAQAQGMLSD